MSIVMLLTETAATGKGLKASNPEVRGETPTHEKTDGRPQ